MGGKGKKKSSQGRKEISQQSWTPNSSVPARNLRKCDLAGVIFGCKHYTINECFSKKLFGLPASHFAYVRNVNPGLPVFLFNYSDRKLHGIFEAASKGQMYIDKYAWMEDHSALTCFPAQIKVKTWMECQPLVEDQFKPVIARNYYEPSFFWFELDRDQANELISLFSRLPKMFSKHLTEKDCVLPLNSGQDLPHWDCSHLNEAGDQGYHEEDGYFWEGGSETGKLIHEKKGDILLETNSGECNGFDVKQLPHSWSSLFKPDVVNTVKESKGVGFAGNIQPQRSWSSLFELDVANTMKELKGVNFAGNILPSDDFVAAQSYSPAAACLEERTDMHEIPTAEECRERIEGWHAKDNVISNESAISDLLDIKDEECTVASVNTHFSSRKDYSFEASEATTPQNHEELPMHTLLTYKDDFHIDAQPVGASNAVVKFINTVERLIEAQLQQAQKIGSLEKELVEANKRVRSLEDRCTALESGSIAAVKELSFERGRNPDGNWDDDLNWD